MVVDASVAVKWFLAEDRSAEARRLLDERELLSAPSFLKLEVAHVVWRAVRGRRAPPEVLAGVDPALNGLFDLLAPDPELLPAAVRLALSLDHPVYDCLYIALALRDDAPLVTADDRQLAAARAAGADVRPL